MSALIQIVTQLPVGTNLSMLHFLWMLVSGALLPHRGALFPALQSTGIGEAAVRRAWHAFRGGMWQIGDLIVAWEKYMQDQQGWKPRLYEGFNAVVVDTTPFWRPKLKGLLSKYYHSAAEKALPAVILGLIARIGEVQGRRLALPKSIVRVHPKKPSEAGLKKELLSKLKQVAQEQDIMVADAGFRLNDCHEAQIKRYLLRLPKNFTARRNYLTYVPRQRGKKPILGRRVRPLTRQYKEKETLATPPDESFTWTLPTGEILSAQVWYDLLRTDAELSPQGDFFDVFAITDPRYDKPLLVATNVKLRPQTVHALYIDRWPIEQLPLAAKQMVGSHRQFVFGTETRHRLPELVVLAGSILTGLAALYPAMPTGFWDKDPKPTPGRFRRALMGSPFPQSYPLPRQLRQKASVTDHLPKGISAHRRQKQEVIPIST